MKKYIIDRFEEEYAIIEDCEDGTIINVLKSLLPIHSKEGDILEYNNDIYTILENESKIKKESIQERFNKMIKK